jgi:hypothetical protein
MGVGVSPQLKMKSTAEIYVSYHFHPSYYSLRSKICYNSNFLQ